MTNKKPSRKQINAMKEYQKYFPNVEKSWMFIPIGIFLFLINEPVAGILSWTYALGSVLGRSDTL